MENDNLLSVDLDFYLRDGTVIMSFFVIVRKKGATSYITILDLLMDHQTDTTSQGKLKWYPLGFFAVKTTIFF